MPDHHAFLNSDPSGLIQSLADMAEKNGFDVQRLGQTTKIAAPLGHVTFTSRGGGADVTFSANSNAELQVLTDLYAQRIESFGYNAAMTWDSPTSQVPLNQRIAHVQSSQQISPNFQRVRLEGDFTAFLADGAGLHFRLLFGPEESDWPTRDERGVTHWPGGASAWNKPVYTVRRISPEGDWIDTDIALFDRGRTSVWSRAVKPGQEIAVTGPNGGALRTAEWLGLIGDETALPVILRMLEAAPPETKGQAVLFLRDKTDMQQVTLPAEFDLTIEQMHATDPVDAIDALRIPEDNAYVFFAAERSQVSRARSILKDQGLSSRVFTAASYWTTPET